MCSGLTFLLDDLGCFPSSLIPYRRFFFQTILTVYYLASYPFNLERKKIHLFPMKPGEKNRFSEKKRFLVAILKFSDETGSRFLNH